MEERRVMELQSGFVIAVIVAAVLFVEHVGGADELARRLFQLSLAAALLFTTVAGTATFLWPADSEDLQRVLFSGSSSQSDDPHDAGNRLVAARTIEFGIGIAALLGGLGSRRRWHTVPTAFILGGLLLVLTGGLGDLTTEYRRLLNDLFAASKEVDAINFVMLLGGTAALLWYGLARLEPEWEVVDEPDAEGEAHGAE
jgi:hypothetical protein